MISSVIAKLVRGAPDMDQTVNEISSQPGIEVGEMVDDRLLPITIETAGNREMEETTRWLQARTGVEFVDVVFVHFEEDDIG